MTARNSISVYRTSHASSGRTNHWHAFAVLWITSGMNDSSQYGIDVIRGIAKDQ
jgi:hypothetical protein